MSELFAPRVALRRLQSLPSRLRVVFIHRCSRLCLLATLTDNPSFRLRQVVASSQAQWRDRYRAEQRELLRSLPDSLPQLIFPHPSRSTCNFSKRLERRMSLSSAKVVALGSAAPTPSRRPLVRQSFPAPLLVSCARRIHTRL